MAEQTSGSISIAASPEEIMAVITDFDAYPRWAEGVKRAEIKNRDSQKRPNEVYMEAGSMGFDAKYTLSYKYKPKNAGLSWTSKSASGVVKDIKGEYALKARDNGTTEVTYQMATELAMPVPGFLTRRGEKQIVDTALKGLKKEVEGR